MGSKIIKIALMCLMPLIGFGQIGYRKVDTALVVTEGGQVQTWKTWNYIKNAMALKIALAQKGAANGVASLDNNGKIPLTQINDALVGSVNYQGNYNASNNTPALPSATGNKGAYYVISVAGTQQGLDFNSGDWIISNGTIWQKVDNNNKVTSVNGKLGAVNLAVGDISGAAKTDGSNATGTWPIGISGNAATATNSTKWALQDFKGAATGVDAFMTNKSGTNEWGYATPLQVKSALGISDGSTLTNNISGNAANSTKWNNQSWTDSPLPSFISIMTNNGSGWGYTSKESFKSELGIPSGGETLQSVTDRGNTTSNRISTGGYPFSNDFGSNFNITLSTGTGSKGINMGYNPVIEAGFIGVVENALAWRNLVLSPIGGNVGIGITNPSAKLHVDGDVKIGDLLQLNNSISFKRISNTEFRLGDGSDWRITSLNGNVGIGTTAPIARLQVTTNDQTNPLAYFYNPNTAAGKSNGIVVEAGTNSTDYAADFRNSSGTSLLKVRGDGSVGIGTTSPLFKLHVAGEGYLSTAVSSPTINVMAKAGTNQMQLGTDAALGFYIKDIDFGNANRMTIDQSGNATFYRNVSASNVPTSGDHLTNKTYVDGLITGATYSPTTTIVSGATSASANKAHYTKVGNQVTVYGTMSVSTSALGQVNVELSLPVASTLGSDDLTGVGSINLNSSTFSSNLIAQKSSSGTKASLYFNGPNGNFTVYYSYMYTVN